MPVNLILKYRGWYQKETIDCFERYGQVILDRYHDRVKLWINVNQINLISHESILHLGIPSDTVNKMQEAKYQGVVNEMIGCARTVSYTHLDVYKRQRPDRASRGLCPLHRGRTGAADPRD